MFLKKNLYPALGFAKGLTLRHPYERLKYLNVVLIGVSLHRNTYPQKVHSETTEFLYCFMLQPQKGILF